MKLTPITALAALILIGAGGFIAGKISSSDPAAVVENGPSGTKSTRSSSSASSSETGIGPRKSSFSRTETKRQESPKERLARLESIVRGENSLERNRALLAYIDQLGPGDFEDAVASFRALGITESRMGEYSLLLTAWAQVDPTSALAFAKENTRNGFARDTILTTWASTDPDAAIRWAQANFDGDGANPYLPGIIRGLVGTDPVKATELLTSMPRSEERGEGLDSMLPYLLKQGTAQTQAWITALKDDALRNGAMMRVAEDLAATDPAGTAAWLIANPGEATQRRMDDVYGVWASKDMSAAMSSFAALPAGAERSNALRGVVSSVATSDPQAAVGLLDRYPSDVTDRVVQNVIWHSFGTDPATAASQIARITDQGERENTYRRTLDVWFDRDPAAAQAWLQTNPIPESVQNHLNRRQQVTP